VPNRRNCQGTKLPLKSKAKSSSLRRLGRSKRPRGRTELTTAKTGGGKETTTGESEGNAESQEKIREETTEEVKEEEAEDEI